jgi:hypothetical protein
MTQKAAVFSRFAWTFDADRMQPETVRHGRQEDAEGNGEELARKLTVFIGFPEKNSRAVIVSIDPAVWRPERRDQTIAH